MKVVNWGTVDQVEAALHESQRAFSTLISNLPGLAYRCRNDPDWTTEFVSDGARQLTGYPAEDFTSHRVAYNDLIHPADRGWLWADTQRALEASETKRLFETSSWVRPNCAARVRSTSRCRSGPFMTW